MKNNFNISGDYQFNALHNGKLMQRSWHALRLEAAKISLKKCEYNNVLDAGCGSGIMLNAVCSLGMNLTGIDFSMKSVEFAEKYLTDFSPNIIHAEIEKTELQPQSQDLILCCEVLEHIELKTAIEALKHFNKLLKSEGYLYITVPNVRSIWPLIEKFLDLTKLVPQLCNSQHVTKYTQGKMKKLIEDAGFSIVESGTFNLVSPWVYVFSKLFGKLILKTELKILKFGGPLLYVLAKKL